MNGLDLEPEGVEQSRDRKGQSGTCCSAIWIKQTTTLICLRFELCAIRLKTDIKDDFKKFLEFCRMEYFERNDRDMVKYEKGHCVSLYLLAAHSFQLCPHFSEFMLLTVTCMKILGDPHISE